MSLIAALGAGRTTLVVLFGATQGLYFLVLVVMAYFYTRPVDRVELDDLPSDEQAYPHILLLYPVLREPEETMRTTFLAIDKIDYPGDRYRIVAIPNHDDAATIAALQRLQAEFPWLEILTVPSTADPSWNVVWDAWSANPKAYWWHAGKRARNRDLPPKKTRQLVYAFYTLCPAEGDETLVSYIDADSAPPPSYFILAAAGSTKYDVVQLTNVAGNPLKSRASTFHAFDHMCWDASMYAHMSAHGKHPYYVLGKGLFYRSSDLHALGSFHPWLTIEDPEVGMRLWVNGRRLGVSSQPLVEEVPDTFRGGVSQRKRWICGFFQSASTPLKQMGMTFRQRMLARLNVVPCTTLLVNLVGLPVGTWILTLVALGDRPIDLALTVLAAVNVAGLVVIVGHNWLTAWRMSGLVLGGPRARLQFVWRVNPLALLVYWVIWVVPLVMGMQMFLRDRGLAWERTEKVDANHDLIRAFNDLAGMGVAEAEASV
ncbi:MAG TPA: glycosyltransferase family 2 protein [Acidimicrobiales bacterium]|nr:glycosyltransferase family 2 protein [Acidimicrobiales bacterium]